MTLQPTIDEKGILRSLEETVKIIDSAAKFGSNVASQIERIFLVGSGATYYAAACIQDWFDQFENEVDVRAFRSADFVTSKPKRCNERALVLLISAGGETPETREAAELAQNRACKTAIFTKFNTSSLAAYGDGKFFMGETSDTFIAYFMLALSVAGAVLKQEENQALFSKLVPSLKALPAAFVAAATKGDFRAKKAAEFLKNDNLVNFFGSGAGWANASVTAYCDWMEIFGDNTHVFHASNFPHYTLEVTGINEIPAIIILGDDHDRPTVERVKKFFEKYGGRTWIYDVRDFAMTGIDQEFRPLLGPFVIQGALRRIIANLALEREKDLSSRKFMGKCEY